MENKILRENYKQRIQNLKEIDLNTYLEEGFKINQESILKAMDYFKSCMPLELKIYLLKNEYWNLYYNKDMEKLLIQDLNINNEDYKKAISVFVYAFQNDKRDFYKQEDEEILKEKLLKEGFKEQFILKNINGEMVFLSEELKLLHNLKVVCVFDRDKIGLMGSFTQKEQHEGKFIFNESQNKLFFLPKRHTKTGQNLINKFYYKQI